MNRKRILQVNIDNDGGNGAFTLVRYIYTYLKKDYVFDYFTMGKFIEDAVFNDIVQDGGKCFSADLRDNKLIGHLKLPFVFYRVLTENHYDVVHIHSEVAYKHFLYAIAAKYAGVKKIIIHSHSSDIDGSNKGLKFLLHKVLRAKVNKYGDYFLACSEPAAKWMFNSKTLQSSKYSILHNGVDPSKYCYSETVRNYVRNSFNISDKIVLGHVGALKMVKNQGRLLEILATLNSDKYVLMLIGDGEDRNLLEEKAKKLNIECRVLVLGSRTDVSELLQAIDVFVFPSFFEGIPMALIEAQAIGIPIIASDRINKDVKINDNMIFISLDASDTRWIQEINRIKDKHLKQEGADRVRNSEYNIEKSAKVLGLIYDES